MTLPDKPGTDLSLQQQRVLHLQQRYPGRALCAQGIYQWAGDAASPSVVRGLAAAIVQRETIFRLWFEPDDAPTSVALNEKAEAAAMMVVDLTALSHRRRRTVANAFGKADRGRPVPFHRQPLLRVTCIVIARDRLRLIMTAPGLCADEASMKLIGSRLGGDLVALVAGRPTNGDAFAYEQFAKWQRRFAESHEADLGLEHWQRVLRGAELRPRLPAACQLHGDGGCDEAAVTVHSHSSITQRAAELAGDADVDASVIWLTAWLLLLTRLRDGHESTVAVIMDGRGDDVLDEAVGPFARYAPIRFNEDRCKTPLAAVRDVQQQLCDALEFHDCLPSRFTDAAHQAGGDGFAIGFEYVHEVADNRGGFATLQTAAAAEPFDLRLRCTEDEGNVRLALTFNRRRYHRADLSQLLDQVQHIVRTIARKPDVPLRAIDLIEARQRRRLLHHFNNTAVDAPIELVHRMFEKATATTPDRVALAADGRAWSYRLLNREANRLAHRLASKGVGPDVVAACLFEPGADMVKAMLAVLKAGGAFLPLDPVWPRGRQQQALAQSRARVLLTSDNIASVTIIGDLPDHVEITMTDDPRVADAPDHDLAAPIDDANLAYVIYTSGSTGEPNGVMISHGALSNHMRWMQRTFPLSSRDRLLQKTTWTFDAAQWELLAPLMAGATLVLASRQVTSDMLQFAQVLQNLCVTNLQVTPQLLAAMIEHDLPARVGALERLFSGGEALASRLVRSLPQKLLIVNLYGPTECCIDTTFHHAEGTDQSPVTPIGRPIDNVQVYIVDRHWRLASHGACGEMYVGGRGLGRGYVGRPGLTAQMFLPDDTSGLKGQRLYRSGDRAVWSSQGRLHFQGRIDEQVKINGVRVEPAEVEAALVRCDGVAQAAVVAMKVASVEDEAAQPATSSLDRTRLVAFVVTDNDRPVPRPSIIEQLRISLPQTMLPAAVHVCSKLPLTAHGKVDRAALRQGCEADTWRPRDDRPTSQLEKRLADVWAKVLGRDRVGVNDNFFMLGGDSILTIDLVTRARQVGIDLSLRSVFDHPTIAGLALVATIRSPEHNHNRHTDNAAPQSADQCHMGPLTPMAGRWLGANGGRPRRYTQAVSWSPRTQLNCPAAATSYAALVRQHESLRQRLVDDAGQPAALFAPAHDVAPPTVVDLSGMANAHTASTIARCIGDARRHIDLSNGPIARALFIQTTSRPADHAASDRIVMACHHMAVDHVSWRIIADDLASAYRAARKGLPIHLPQVHTTLRRWTQALGGRSSAAPVRAVDPAAASTPPDDASSAPSISPPPRITTDPQADSVASTKTVRGTAAADLTQRLIGQCKLFDVDLEHAIVTAVVISIARWLNRNVISIDVEGHGRADFTAGLDASRTVGWLTVMNPVRITASPADDVAGLIKTAAAALRSRRHEVADQSAGGDWSPWRINYLGRLDTWLNRPGEFQWCDDHLGQGATDDAVRTHLIDVTAFVRQGRLHLHWNYSDNRYDRTTIEGLAEHSRHLFTSYVDSADATTRNAPPGLAARNWPLACSPKPDPDVMRVPTGRTAKETHDEGQTEFSARDHSQAPRSGAAQGGRAEHG